MAPVRVTRALRLPIIAIMAALALSGCMRTSGPVAVATQGDLDAMAHGQPYSPAPVAVADSGGGGAISALPASFAASPRGSYAPAPAPAAYAAPAIPVTHDAPYPPYAS